MPRDVRTVLFSTLYPSSARPLHGVFVQTRLRELLRHGGVATKVVAPVPWFPSTDRRWGAYADMARTPRRESLQDVDVRHPRYLAIPKLGMTLAPMLLAAAARPALARLLDEGFDFDLIDAHYFYPDGVAAALLARHFGKALAITARGSDLNLIAHHALPRRMMQWAGRQAQASIGVSQSLVEVLRSWRLPEQRLHMMRNGVDLARFHPLPLPQARALLRLEGSPLLLSVGRLVAMKGHDLAIGALARIAGRWPAARLLIVGDGPERAPLQAQAAALGVPDRVVFAGNVAHEDMAQWYSAADMLILASSREGWPNVLLEAMACGTPVVASRVGGVAEVLTDRVAGLLVENRDVASFATAVLRLLDAPPPRPAVRRFAEGFDWSATSRQQLDLFRGLAFGGAPALVEGNACATLR